MSCTKSCCCQQVEKIHVGHDGQRSPDDWYLEEIVLNSSVRGEHLVFPCSAWIVADQGDGTIEKELYPKQPSKCALHCILRMWADTLLPILEKVDIGGGGGGEGSGKDIYATKDFFH